MYDKIAKSSRGIGDLLMDQSVVAGVGNVYRAEALFVCGIHPLRPGKECDPAELEALWATITGMLRQGVKDGRILTVPREESGVPRGKRIPRSEATYAYKRDIVSALRERDPAARHRESHQLPLPHLPAPLIWTSQRTSNQTPVCAVPM